MMGLLMVSWGLIPWKYTQYYVATTEMDENLSCVIRGKPCTEHFMGTQKT